MVTVISVAGVLSSVGQAKFPEISHFFNQHDSSFGRHVNVKAKKLKRGLSQNQEPIRSEKLYGYYFSAVLIHHESKIPGGSIVL